MARILLIGATGVFGSRLAAHLAREAESEIILASRSLERARKACADLAAMAETRAILRPIAFDARQEVAATISALAPGIVIDCSGPFQGSDYRLPEAAIRAGSHFIDLADARDYLLGFADALDALAKQNGVTALTGASTSPALSAAALAELTVGWRRIDHIAIALVPGGRSPTGEAAIKASLSYCGRPVPVVSERHPGHVIGWSGGARIDVAELGSRAVAPVETADAELLAKRYPDAASIRFMAGLESPIEHQGMRVLSRLRRFGLKLEALASLLPYARRLTRIFTRDTGGMVVKASGIDTNGRWSEAVWTLIARRNHGPHVPPAPAAAAVRAILAGDVKPGARVCLDLPLAVIERELTPYAIRTSVDRQRPQKSVLEAALPAHEMARLPPLVAAFHAMSGEALWSGEASVNGAGHLITRMIARAVGFPEDAASLPVTVMVERECPNGDGPPIESGTREIWTRKFGDRRFHSRFDLLKKSEAWERFGPFSFRIGFTVDDAGRLGYPVTAWRFAGLPLPLFLAPRSDSVEWQDEEGRFRFDVAVALPLLGRLVRYRGWLRPSSAPDRLA